MCGGRVSGPGGKVTGEMMYGPVPKVCGGRVGKAPPGGNVCGGRVGIPGGNVCGGSVGKPPGGKVCGGSVGNPPGGKVCAGKVCGGKVCVGNVNSIVAGVDGPPTGGGGVGPNC